MQVLTMPRCIDCAHQSEIDWSHGLTELSGYCLPGDQYIGIHVNKHGVNQSLHAQRKCRGYKPKVESDSKQKETPVS